MERRIRFSDLVRKSGRPQVVTLWTNPGSDRAFSRAVKERKILTVIKERGAKEFGVIGFRQQPNSSYLIFPKALPQEPQSRVVGINYDLVDVPGVPVGDSKAKPQKPITDRLPRARKPAETKFSVIVLRTATLETAINVQAANPTIAREKAARLAQAEPFDLSKAVFRTEILSHH